MRILKNTDEEILFDDGRKIEYHHSQDCCEDNYADFSQLEEEALEYTFNSDLKFEFVDESGFRFGDERRMFFVPCYSNQNGYYSSDISIVFDGKEVLHGECKWIEESCLISKE